MAAATKVIAILLILSVSSHKCRGSAIPIWEFLSRNEKMSYLYSTFAQLVSVHCKTNAAAESLAIPVNQCKRNLLAYGYDKLQTFTDMQLDTFDPYQRGANELIWSSIMQGHPGIRFPTTRNPFPTPPVTSLIILSQPPSSATSSPPPLEQDNSSSEQQHTQHSISTGSDQTSYPKNPIFETDAEHKHTYAMDMDIAYGYSIPSNPVDVETFLPTMSSPEQTSYLTGPLVFRVRPDGSPVEEDKHKPLPSDDDLDAFQLTKQHKIATISKTKQRRLATIAIQQMLTPPPQQQQLQSASGLVQRSSANRHFKVANQSSEGNAAIAPATTNFYYNRGLVQV